MKIHKYFLMAMLVLVIELIVVAWLGYSLPADTRIPMHWNIHSEIDGWASRNTAILPFWLFNLGLFLLMMFSRQLSPVFKQNRERYDAVIPGLTLILVIFFALIHVYMLVLGHYPELESKVQFIFILMGAMFICLGNILPKVPRNFIAGYKISWTLYSDEIWRRTHRLAGFCFVIFGAVLMLKGIFNLRTGWANAAMLIGLLGLAIVPIIYSFILFKLRKNDE
jgi:uncharacterized membrane protein